MARYDGRSMRRQTKIQRKPSPKASLAVQQAYWDAVLAREGVTMDRGRSSKLVYVGGNAALSAVEHAVAANLQCGGGKRAHGPKAEKFKGEQ